jgi:hypothetical protein
LGFSILPICLTFFIISGERIDDSMILQKACYIWRHKRGMRNRAWSLEIWEQKVSTTERTKNLEVQEKVHVDKKQTRQETTKQDEREFLVHLDESSEDMFSLVQL